ncbi:MAG: hypothetical protein DPW09_20540 [Anaerolineae bacterium]|nr:PD40 domain-containing protein [Anaerolineales bacterium]MCQ3975832.1 hypothetical protein [Anaerolineae bacterium]
MDDEVREAHQEAFDHIILGLTLLGLAGSGLTFILLGPTSLWFLRAIALLAVVLIAFVLRRAGQFVVAVYVLVLELIGLVAGAFLQTDVFTSFIPYLFIPIIIIAGLILSPPVTLVAALFSIALALLLVTATGQFTSANLLALLPPFGLLLLTAILAALSGRYVAKTDNRLAESKKLLRERTLELLRAMEDAQHLQSQVEGLKTQLLETKTETQRAFQLTTHRDQRLSGLVAGAIQELKTSVAKLEQAVEALAQTSADSPGDLLPAAWRQIDLLTGLIINLEEMVKLEQPEVQLDVQPIDLTQLLAETVQVAAGLARDKQLDLRYKPPVSLPPIPADPSRLRQALLHLLSNAVKFTDQGMVEVQTEVTGAEVVIFISDTGIGMSNEELTAIFQNFSRGQNAPAKQLPGAGLGLSLSKRIIELHGGRLWATSVVGVGSTFCLALPLEAANVEQTLVASPLQRPQIADIVAALQQNKPAQPVAAPVSKPAPAAGVKAVPDRPQANFSPVARFSPVYINRFGVTLLLLLLIISSLVLALALINNLSPSQAQIAQVTPITSPVSVTKSAALPKIPSPTRTPTPPAPTATIAATPMQPQPTPTVIGARPTHTPAQEESFQQPLLTSTSTPSPTPSPAATATSSPTTPPTITPTAIPTATPTVTPQPVNVTVVPAAAQPANPPAPALPLDLSAYAALDSLGFASVPRSQLTLTSNPAANSGLTWLPGASGYQALFSDALTGGDRDLYLTSVDGSVVNLTQSAGDDLQPAVSPDGRRIAFSSGRSGNLDIYVMDANGSNLTQLTSSRGFDEWPAWSPDGGTLAFVSDRAGNVEIYTIPANGGPEQRLTDHPADDWPAVWSPDGRRLLFASNRDGNWNLFLLELADGTLTRLTSDPGDEREPAWSPDGRTLAFAHSSGDNWNIFTIPAPSAAPAEIPRSQWTQMTTSSRDERYPTWLP